MGRKLVNSLNDLNGSQWLYWTDTIYITNSPPDPTHRLRKQHGAMKPPDVMADIIRFFTKQGELVVDPFAGVGGTLLGADLALRRSLGFELNPRWVDIFHSIQQDFVIQEDNLVSRHETGIGKTARAITGEMRQGDCLELIRDLPSDSVDAVITDPPYGCQHGVKGFAAETNFNMFNGGEELDFANAPDLDTFLEMMRTLGREVYRVLRRGRYFVLMIGDRYQRGEYVPMGYLVGQAMRQEGFRLKGVKIWCNKATQRPLKPYAVMTCFVPNITHQNIVILRKE